MKRMLSIVTVIIGLALSHYVALADMPPPKDKNENPNIAAARKSIEAKDFKAAVGQLTKAVQEEPKNADVDSGHRSAHEYLGELYLDMDQPDNAEKQLTALKKACPFFGKCEEYEDLKKAVDSYKAKKK